MYVPGPGNYDPKYNNEAPKVFFFNLMRISLAWYLEDSIIPEKSLQALKAIPLVLLMTRLIFDFLVPSEM